jgi:PadR family transcriptional regulator, regulatory protein PadR
MSDEMRNRDGEFRSCENRPIDIRPKNWLIPVVLVTLREKASHGYELMERIARFGFESINPGTLYRALKRMENEGLCEGAWESSEGGGPARRLYSITDTGEAYLGLWTEGCKKYQKVLDSFFLAHNAARAAG